MTGLGTLDLALVDADDARGLGVIAQLDKAAFLSGDVAEQVEGFTHGGELYPSARVRPPGRRCVS